MRKLKPNDVRHLGARDLRNRALRAIDTINDLRWIADNAEHIARLVNDNIDDALRGRSYDGDGRGHTDHSTVEAHLDRRTDDHDHTTHDHIWCNVVRLLGTIDLITDSATTARRTAGELGNIRASGESKLSAGAGTCSNCGRWCPGIANDRLKSGRCIRIGGIGSGCYEHWIASGRRTERPLDDHAETA